MKGVFLFHIGHETSLHKYTTKIPEKVVQGNHLKFLFRTTGAMYYENERSAGKTRAELAFYSVWNKLNTLHWCLKQIE